jgi:dTDP-4-amino-4,6-dideoxygalactose transaminase
MIRLASPSIDEDDLEAVREVLLSGQLVQGKRVAEFERVVADYVGVEHAVAVSNCTAALHLSLLSVGVGPGDRVAVSTYSWPATANVIALCGAEPVFVDIDPITYNMNPSLLDATLRRTSIKAILPVDVFGCMADLSRICSLAEEWGVPVIEDAACALGGDLNGRKAGAWGTAGCFSFHPRKAVTTGEGGMITTDSDEIARSARRLRNHGLDPDSASPDFVVPGYNLRLTEIQAALGVTQMAKLERLLSSRARHAELYDELLAKTELVRPRALAGSRHVFQSYVVLLPERAASRRAEIIGSLRQSGIEVTIGTYHMPMTTFFRRAGSWERGAFPVTDVVAKRALSLPLFDTMSPEQQRSVVDSLVATL